VAAFLTALDVVQAFFWKFDHSDALKPDKGKRIALLPRALNHVLEEARRAQGKDDAEPNVKRWRRSRTSCGSFESRPGPCSRGPASILAH
jgi:hypothetical protein